MNAIIISLDVGSSSIRCTPYTISTDSKSVQAISKCTIAKKISSVRPNSGKIILIQQQHADTNQHISISNMEGNSNDSKAMMTLFDEIDNCIDESLSKLRSEMSDFQIVGLGVSSFVMNLIGIDEEGQLILTDNNNNNDNNNNSKDCEDGGGGGGGEHTFSYACNSQDVVNECMSLKKELGQEKLLELYQRTGTPLHNAYALAQLRVHHQIQAKSKNENKSKMMKRVHQWTTIASYCILRWTGQWKNFKQIPISYSEASWTGLFNYRTCQWDDECCNLLPQECFHALPLVDDYKLKSYYIEEYMDKVGGESNPSSSSTPSSLRVRNPYWERWPEFRSLDKEEKKSNPCRIFLGFGDGVCANVGSKCTSTDRIACTIGTSAAIRRIIPVDKQIGSDFNVPFGLFCYRIDSNRLLLGGALTDGGSIVEFLRSLLNLNKDEHFLNCLNESSEKYHNDINDWGVGNSQSRNDLCVVPFLSGERSVGFRGGATGCIIGLTRETKPSDMMRSSLESVILRLCQILKLIETTSESKHEKPTCIVASGNALERNTLWRQMLSDCTRKRVVMDKDAHEGTSRGVSILVSKELFQLSRHSNDVYVHEELVVGEERDPIASSQQYWKDQINQQEEVIDCIHTLWAS